ncbi:hypothetical protein BC828DRAFT_408895 [Blastocladiella britannica]|nr:hypothetical protein BC828DRAFT_408895 [Blastocladiella britannica]
MLVGRVLRPCVRHRDSTPVSDGCPGPARRRVPWPGFGPATQNLTTLAIFYSKFDARTPHPWSAMLPPTLTHLVFTGDFGELGVRAIATRMPPALEVLLLTGNQLGNKGTVAIVAALPPTLTKLDISNNDFGYRGAAAIATKLPSLPLLAELSLVGDIGNKVTELELAISPIYNQGVAALAPNLPTSLTTLSLSVARITTAGVVALASALPLSLLTLDLARNNLGDAGVMAIAKHMPPRLTHLNLSSTGMGDAGAKTLAASPLRSVPLLDLGGNMIGPGARAIAAWMPPSLQELSLWLNNITETVKTTLREAWGTREQEVSL